MMVLVCIVVPQFGHLLFVFIGQMYPTLPHIGSHLGKNLYYFLITKSQSFLQVSASYRDPAPVTYLAVTEQMYELNR